MLNSTQAAGNDSDNYLPIVSGNSQWVLDRDSEGQAAAGRGYRRDWEFPGTSAEIVAT
jgi:hypothetical protein